MKTTSIKKHSELEQTIGVEFKDKDLLTLAFVHKSFINEHTEEKEYNERLEFLGDAVLELSVTQFLYHKYPDQPEGQLTSWRSALVKGKNLAKVSKSLGLGQFLLLSRGEDLSGGREKEYILANTCEALIGAIFLDQGFEVANQFILDRIVVMLDEIIAKGLNVDAKSRVQELAQDKFNLTPTYELLNEDGPDHDKKFVMGIYFGKKLAGEGSGQSKQEAEQAAARNAMERESWN
ncbi:MAG: ribonuclease III [Candidatus Gracilibacteria bacterium]|jgi:ribonuclease-3